MGNTGRWLTLVAFAGAMLAPPAIAQERTAIRQGFTLAPNSNKRILVFRPSVRVGEQSTAGLFEPNAEWTETGRQNILTALEKIQGRFGNQIMIAPDAVGEDARNLEEHMALFAAVSGAVIQYQFFVGNRLPTKKRDNKAGVFDWSLGSSVASLPGAQDADYALFLYNKDEFGSTGRKMLQIVGMLGGVGITSGVHIGYAGLVDLKTGDLVWLNADGQMGGDVRDPAGSEKRVAQLLEEFPGSDIGKVPTP